MHVFKCEGKKVKSNMNTSIDEHNFSAAFTSGFEESFLTLLKRTVKKTYISNLKILFIILFGINSSLKV